MTPIDDLPPPPSRSARASSIDDLPPPPSAGGPTPNESGLRGALSGITASFDDEITGAVGAAGRLAGVKNLGSWKPFVQDSKLEMTSAPLSVDEIVTAYRENRDAIRDEQKRDMATNPKATIAGNLAGAVLSPASKVVAGQKVFGPLTKGQTFVQGMKTAAAQGAIFGAGASNADLTEGNVGGFAADTALSAGLGAAIPPALVGAGFAAKKGAQASGWAGKRLFSSAFGPSSENVTKYLASSERINAAKSLGEIKDLVDESVSALRDAVEQGKVTESEAKEALRGMKEQVTRGLSDKKVDAKDALRAADTAFQGAKERVLAPLKSTSAPTHSAADASTMVSELKAKVIAEAKAARESLTDVSDVDLTHVYQSLDDSIEKLLSAGTKDAKAAAAELQDYKAGLMKQYWAKIPASEAKNKITGLDAITEYSPMQGSFDKAKNKAFKGARHALDQSLKEGSTQYRDLMKLVAEKSALLEDANAAFGSPEIAVGKLGRLNTPRGEFDRATLGKLEQAVERPGAVTKEADQFAAAQRILKDPQALRKIEQGLPEYQTLRQAMVDVAKRNPKWTREQIEQATAKERRALAAATGKRIFAERRMEPFKGLAPGSTENKIKSVMKGERSNIENAKVLERLGKESGQDFLQMADDLGVKRAFEGGNTNGSRNTLFWGVLGAVTGGIPGALGGAAFGSQVIDRYGPRVGKSILDGLIKVRNNPSVKTIRSLSLPESVKNELEREFRAVAVVKNASAHGEMPRVAGPSDGPPKTGPDRWAQSGLEKLGIQDRAIADKLLQSKEGKQLLIDASDLPPGSRAMQQIKDKIQKGFGVKYGNESIPGTSSEVLRRERKPSSGW